MQVLQRPNPPIIDNWKGKSKSNTRSATGNYDAVVLDDAHPSVQRWTDFNIRAIKLAFGHLLDQSMRTLEAKYRDPLTPTPSEKVGVIVKEGSVDVLGRDWTAPIVKMPLRVAGRHLRPIVALKAATSTNAALKDRAP